jgi:2-polyprenyl-3-methyl-5-hydroxy-6-metoxy-1,4-benzoquinol methylase
VLQKSRPPLEDATDALPLVRSVEIQRRLEKNADNYNRWIYEQIGPHLGRRILDVGCSIGNITQFYLDRDLVIGMDVVAEGLDLARARFRAKPFEAYHLDIASPDVLRFRSRSLDTAVCLNVLEHVEDDVNALRNIRGALLPNSTVCLLTPMNKWLFGPMDAIDQHFRRYIRSELSAKLAAADLSIVHQRYFNMLGIAAWWLQNRVIGGSMAAPSQYGLFDKLVPFLSKVESIIAPPVGLSMVTICKTPA